RRRKAIAHCRRARHAPASGGSRLRALVRRSTGSHLGPACADRRRYRRPDVMIVLGLTGSIGMGKSTAARMFAEAGVPVHDSDETVHRLYAGEAAGQIEARFPGTVVDGVVDRQKLAAAVLGKPEALRDLERI